MYINLYLCWFACLFSDLDVEVKDVFRVGRSQEEQNFTKTVHNKQMLFHASRAKNLIGILSR